MRLERQEVEPQQALADYVHPKVQELGLKIARSKSLGSETGCFVVDSIPNDFFVRYPCSVAIPIVVPDMEEFLIERGISPMGHFTSNQGMAERLWDWTSTPNAVEPTSDHIDAQFFRTVLSTSGHILGFWFGEKRWLFVGHLMCDGHENHKNLLDGVMKLARTFGIEKKKPTTKKRVTMPSGIMIGSDIEFSVFDSDGLFHSALEFVPDNVNATIGTDGNVETLEIRPDCGKSVDELCENISHILRNLSEVLPPGYDLLGGGGGSLRRSTGTHVHFSGTSVDYGKENNNKGIKELIYWLDAVIGDSLLVCKGAGRGDPHYGMAGDYRNSHNHREFPHKGFEWRRPPTFAPSPNVMKGFYAACWCVLMAWETYTPIEFDARRFGIDRFKDLPDFGRYASHIEEFVDFVAGRERLDVPVLAEWFGKDFKKDQECQVFVNFHRDCGFGVADFSVYNPQPMFKRLMITDRGEGDRKVIAFSHEHGRLRSFLVSEYGQTSIVRKTADAPSTTFVLGLPRRFVDDLLQRSQGSRNRLKMFVQHIARTI